LPTSYLTSAPVISGPAVFTGTPLTLTTTAPAGDATTAMLSSAFRLVEAPTAFANGVADGGFENVTANTANLSAPLGEWINDKSKNLGGGGTSRVVSTYAIAGTKNFMLRFIAVSSNGYYNISHKLNGLIAGNTYTFSFKYRVDDGANTNTFTANSQANVYAASTVNDVVANAIGGFSNLYTTSQPSTNISSQTASISNVTFIAPASSCYIVFSKVVQADAPAFYVYMDDMALTQVFSIAASANDVTMGSVSGTGTMALNSPVSLVATPNTGYRFVNWTENGVEVSQSASYSFTAISDRTLIANFVSTTVTLIPEMNSSALMVVYKNLNNQICIKSNTGYGAMATVCNALGQKLVSKSTTGTITVIDKSFCSGVYFVTVSFKGKKITQKVIIN